MGGGRCRRGPALSVLMHLMLGGSCGKELSDDDRDQIMM
jgi:hypothetical protein